MLMANDTNNNTNSITNNITNTDLAVNGPSAIGNSSFEAIWFWKSLLIQNLKQILA